MTDLNLDSHIVERLRCPHCQSANLQFASDALTCTACDSRYPVVDGVPVLLDPTNPLFDIESVSTNYYGAARVAKRKRGGLRGGLRRLANAAPSLGHNLKAEANAAHFLRRVRARGESASVLIVGGGTVGEGSEAIAGADDLTVVSTDVYLSPQVGAVADGHQLPFEDGTFDGVAVQAVLEHVLDPFQVVAEIHRVLKPGGLVYAETPFMQQVHGGAYDFHRFTHLGHRRLFRHFAEVDSGPCCGPGMALAWSYMYFLRALFNVPPSGVRRVAVDLFARYTAFWLKYLDSVMLSSPNGYNAASGFYFIGTRAENPLPDHELIAGFVGV